ncbi:metal-sensing transcriptional repressor [Fusobacterium sp.]|uniref:metal-sensing transcriptional repressor n=1 Tax=Fusobacterium sp. TaxID=68766 RepID=UPI0029038914|nr:metal-sensing transcriptional repressor [Fusobacterium sp.]MDU1910542.1 metal-sensing transcriptional repressor [Fusobacterium sp.]
MEKLKRTCISGECMSKECPAFKRKLESRINRIEGQIRGIGKMLVNKIACDDVLNQISSVKSALNGVSKLILESHIRNCVVNDIKAGSEDEIISELVQTLNKMIDKTNKKVKENLPEMIKKIEIQVGKIKELVEEEHCNEVLNGISLVKGELDGVSKLVLESHIKNCIVRDIKSGNEDKVITELLYTLNKMIK